MKTVERFEVVVLSVTSLEAVVEHYVSGALTDREVLVDQRFSDPW